MMDFSAVKGLTIPEGKVVQIAIGDKIVWGKKKAFAVACSDDGTLTFYCDQTVPAAGSTYKGKTASKVYTGFDTAKYASVNNVPWYNERYMITTVLFDRSFAAARPVSTAFWFSEQNNIANCDLTYLNTSQVTDMQRMFYSCTNLAVLNVSGFDTGKVKNMNRMFYYCQDLVSLDVSGFDTGEVTDMGYLFCGLQLTQLDLSAFDTGNVTNMEYMFSSCSLLETAYVSDRWTTAAVANSAYMFSYARKIVGGNGTAYSSNYIDKTYARIDKAGQPGYFTYKAAPV